MQSLNQIDFQSIKKRYKFDQYCPICKKKIGFGIENRILLDNTNFPYPHIILHGDPIHALVVYIDFNFQVRGSESVKSIEILRDSETFSQIMKKWSNPF